MNRIIKKTAVLCMVFTLLLSVINVNVFADEPVLTYGIEYGENTATVTFYITMIESFDIAVAYDPSKLTVSDCSYTMDFKKLQAGGENTTISVLNDDAKDDAGNTYMVFTGAGANMDSGGSIDFAGKPLCYVTFEGELNGSDLTIVTDSAAADNIYNATPVGRITLDTGTKVEITPEPVNNVVYEKVDANNDSDAAQNGNSGNSGETATESNNVTDSDASVNETESVATESSDSEPETTAAVTDSEKADSDKQALVKDSDKKEEGSVSPVILGVLIAVAVALVVAVIVVVIKKKNK